VHDQRNQALENATMKSQPELLHRAAVCALLGGTRPLHSATLYRNIARGIYPRPVKVGPGSSRWLRHEVEAALAAAIGGRS
jgi:predicted DNA-binding transcriptional regulator AlpA